MSFVGGHAHAGRHSMEATRSRLAANKKASRLAASRKASRLAATGSQVDLAASRQSIGSQSAVTTRMAITGEKAPRELARWLPIPGARARRLRVAARPPALARARREGRAQRWQGAVDRCCGEVLWQGAMVRGSGKGGAHSHDCRERCDPDGAHNGAHAEPSASNCTEGRFRSHQKNRRQSEAIRSNRLRRGVA